MAPGQGITRAGVVLEREARGRESIHCVAGGAIDRAAGGVRQRDLSGMGVFVTIGAIGECETSQHRRAPRADRMAVAARDIPVVSLKRETCSVVVERPRLARRCHGRPRIDRVARAARGAQPPRMGILVARGTLAVVDRLQLQIRRRPRLRERSDRIGRIDGVRVTLLAGHAPMASAQRVSAPIVIEARGRLPTIEAVTGRAISRELTAVFVEVAGGACGVEPEKRSRARMPR